jgi:hypothetical protein
LWLLLPGTRKMRTNKFAYRYFMYEIFLTLRHAPHITKLANPAAQSKKQALMRLRSKG